MENIVSNNTIETYNKHIYRNRKTNTESKNTIETYNKQIDINMKNRKIIEKIQLNHTINI
jgi:hypothetical protein